MRTIAEIEESINSEAQRHEALSGLQNNASRMAFWAYAKKVVAFVALTLEKMFEQHKKDVHDMIERTEAGSLDWYLSTAYAYQHGDSLIIENNRPVYSTVDKNKQIIQRVAMKEQPDATLVFKVVKEEAGVLTPLTEGERNAFTTYLNRKKIVGTRIQVQSAAADSLVLQAEAVLSPLLFNAQGKLIADPAQEPVRQAMEEYVRDFDFGGTFYLSKLTDRVMNIEGVKDFYVRSAALNGTSFNRSIESPAGHIQLKTKSTTKEDTNIATIDYRLI